MEDFVHLHVHTHYSTMDGLSEIPTLVDKAINDGMKGMAITDHGVLDGLKEFADYCAKINRQRKDNRLDVFKPIYGCEMFVACNHKEEHVSPILNRPTYHLILLAKNRQGFENLTKLVSLSWADGYYYGNDIPVYPVSKIDTP